MKNLFEIDEWKIVQNQYEPSKQLQAESIFSIGNGSFGQRANFEEHYSGPTLQGNYLGGIYYPDKTKVGWWKNGYPEYFAKVLNSCNWIGINLKINNEEIDIHQQKVISFHKTLDMKKGILTRNVTLELNNKQQVWIEFTRFCSMENTKLGIVRVSIKPLNFSGKLIAEIYLNGKVYNSDSNYDELFWNHVNSSCENFKGYVSTSTKKTLFHQSTAMECKVECDEKELEIEPKTREKDFFISNELQIEIKEQQTYTITKYVGISTNLNDTDTNVIKESIDIAKNAKAIGFHELLSRHINVWDEIWKKSDIKIVGDKEAQQGIRFNIFQLYQTYTGKNEKLNIGPKGFTGEKYGGATYWDTEAYCLPFYLKTAHSNVAKQLLMYRYNQLDKAIENAKKLGFDDGAALYPMVTMNGEECHNEWEITFEEIHRNGAIAFAIYNYVEHTGDYEYVKDYGIYVLIGIAKFWSQRFNWSEDKEAYVMLGVTGPNEYENNVNNNWYTNYIARWCLTYTLDCLKELNLNLINPKEIDNWTKIIQNTYLPKMDNNSIFLQQDGFLDKEQLTVNDLKKEDRPINQNWSWDRILRSIFIKQADVLQGIYFFEDHFSEDEMRDNFEFYEPKTVHESSLSSCIHAILAAKLNKMDKAYELYLRTSRLDLDDYNQEANEGLHITSMAGTWLSVIEGFAGIRIKKQQLYINPKLPNEWKELKFNLVVNNNLFQIEINHNHFTVFNLGGEKITFSHKDKWYDVLAHKVTHITF